MKKEQEIAAVWNRIQRWTGGVGPPEGAHAQKELDKSAESDSRRPLPARVGVFAEALSVPDDKPGGEPPTEGAQKPGQVGGR